MVLVAQISGKEPGNDVAAKHSKDYNTSINRQRYG